MADWIKWEGGIEPKGRVIVRYGFETREDALFHGPRESRLVQWRDKAIVGIWENAKPTFRPVEYILAKEA